MVTQGMMAMGRLTMTRETDCRRGILIVLTHGMFMVMV